MFTGVAIAQLVEDGDLAFNDPIGMYVSVFPEDVADNVTIHHLLTHTSGMGDFTRNGYPEAAKTATDLLPLIAGEPLQFEPGTGQSYSNSGFVVLGAIIEAITRQSYYDYVREHVFEPAGMTRTDWLQPGRDTDNTARGYMRDDGQAPSTPESGGPSGPTDTLVDNSDVVPWGNPSGGAYSTVGDLQRFSDALLGHELLGPELTTTVLAGKEPGPGGAQNAYGFLDGTMNGVRVVGLSGGAPGVEAAVDIVPDLGYVVVILANYDGAIEPVRNNAIEILTGTPTT